jgi:hypothetical protein
MASAVFFWLKRLGAKGQLNRFTDEMLVYAAAEHIITGEKVVLLTKDEDLLSKRTSCSGS